MNVMVENHPNLFLVNERDFEQSVLNSPIPVIVDFTADWCPPCRVLSPIYARLSDVYQDKLKFVKVDCSEDTRLSASLGIQGLPTLMLFAGGKQVGLVVGPHPARLQQTIEHLFTKASTMVMSK